MPRSLADYLRSTCHAWPCIGFVLPLLALYEIGLLTLAGAQSESLRNGADVWFRTGLTAIGLDHPICAPLLVVILIVSWGLRGAADRPAELPHLWLGMLLESGLFAWALWGMSRLFFSLAATGSPLDASAPLDSEASLQRVFRYLGAGVYEETLFRLLLFSGLVWLLEHVEVRPLWSWLLAAALSSLAFAAAHHLGPAGDPLDGTLFLFRTVAGLAFTALFWLRGFGIVVGTHAGYNVLVGALVAS